MKATNSAELLKRFHVGSTLPERLFFVLCVAVFLSGTHSFTVKHPGIHPRISWDGIVTLVAAAAAENQANQRPLVAKSPKRAPPGKQRFKKKYDKDMAQAIALNKKLISCQCSDEILSLLAATPNALTKTAGGGALNSVNFSTALHRMARFCSYDKDVRKKTLMDPRFALFICSLAEAMAGLDPLTPLSDYQSDVNRKQVKSSLTFDSRECSNIAWAIAKIQLAPPLSVLPLDLSNDHNALVALSLQCRSQVLQGARGKQNAWIHVPALSSLSGRLLDFIGSKSISSKSTCTFNSQEMANLLWALATAQRADANVFEQISSTLAESVHTQSWKPQEFSNSLYAFGKAGIDGTGQELLVKYTADALTNDVGFVDQWKCQELSNLCWSIATILSNKRQRSADEDANALNILRKVATAITERADEFKSQELANTVWAMATLGFGEVETGANSLNDYIYLNSDDVVGDRKLMERALRAVAKSALPRLNVFRSQELNNMAWAYARLGRTEETDLFAGIGREFSRTRRAVTGQDIGTTLWAFATANYFEEEPYREIVSRIDVDAARNYRPQELSNAIYALATAGVEVKYPDAFDTTLVPEGLRPSDWKSDPVTVCFAVAARELMQRPHEFKSQEIKDVLWGFSKAGVRHPVMFKAIAEYLVGKESDTVPAGQLHGGKGLETFTPQGVGNLLWSYGKQALLASETVNRVDGISSVSTGRLFIFSTICVDVGETLIKRLFNCGAEIDLVKFDDLTMLSPQDISNTAYSFSLLGLRHTRFFEAVSRQVVQRLSHVTGRYGSFKGQELANICWACASLNYRFPEMLDSISTYICRRCQLPDGTYNARSIAENFTRQELANVAWSCAVMQHYPPDLMNLLYAGLVGKGDERNPEYLSQVFGDGGLQPQAIMSLLYVQMAVDMEWPDNDLTLPEGFPDGWDTVGVAPADSDLSMLSLSTSRIQSDVSNAFDRIGFDHTEEHVIAMDELVRNHGIRLSSKPAFEILSIDIADVPNKIGVEVDGPGHFCSVLDTWTPQEEARGYAKTLNGKMEYQFQWDDRQQMNGSTALKDRLLKGLGWNILHIAFWEWDKGKEDDYCRRLLQGAE